MKTLKTLLSPGQRTKLLFHILYKTPLYKHTLPFLSQQPTSLLYSMHEHDRHFVPSSSSSSIFLLFSLLFKEQSACPFPSCSPARLDSGEADKYNCAFLSLDNNFVLSDTLGRVQPPNGQAWMRAPSSSESVLIILKTRKRTNRLLPCMK